SGQPDQFYRMALGAILSDRPAAAREMLWAAEGRDSSAAVRTSYWMAWVDLDLGDRERALSDLRAAGVPARAGPAPQGTTALAALARRDTVGAWRLAQQAVTLYALDADAHGLLADLGLALAAEKMVSGIVINAYAARVLAPGSAAAWRRWAFVQIQQS